MMRAVSPLDEADTLRVLTWNVLQPIFADPALYRVGEILEPHVRQKVMHQRLAELGADVVMLQELGRGVLDSALASTGPLTGHGSHFVPVAEVAQTFGGRTDEWGLGIAWRPDVLLDVELVDSASLGVTGCCGHHPVACIVARVAPWGGESAMFVCVHLDGEGCPPALARAQQQARAIATSVSGAARARGVTRIVWGGDFNQPLGTAALREAEAKHGRCTPS